MTSNTVALQVLLLCIFTLSTCSRSFSSKELLDNLSPLELRFHSLDYRNTLHWKPQVHFLKNLVYFVQYKVYGDKQWTNVTHCQGISQLFCDLSQQTSDPREWYYARVQAARLGARSPWVLSSRFNPHWETSISPPSMKLKVTENGIVAQLRPPRSPYRRRGGSWISMRKLHKVSYRIYLTHKDQILEQHELEGCVTQLLFQDLWPGTTYCLQAECHMERLGRTSPRSNRTCVTTL